jgi:CDP-paratose 2-epimerase
VNATGTLNLLQATRTHCPAATFIFTSTNKVYGDTPNRLPLVEGDTRWELPRDHRWFGGVDTSMSIDQTLHSLFGVSKAAADLLVQEFGRYFDMPTVCFRGGCLTGPRHAGARLHGFLSYLMRCTVSGRPYTVYGYKAKQVRDNLHSSDLVDAFLAFHAAPRAGAVYNIGGGRVSNCSMLEAIALCERIAGRDLQWELSDEARIGDHMWWISDLGEFQRDYPGWAPRYDLERTLREIHDENADEWSAEAVAAGR